MRASFLFYTYFIFISLPLPMHGGARLFPIPFFPEMA